MEKPSQSPPWDKTNGNVFFEGVGGGAKRPLGHLQAWGVLSPFNDIPTAWLPCLCLPTMEEGAYFLP